MEALVKIL